MLSITKSPAHDVLTSKAIQARTCILKPCTPLGNQPMSSLPKSNPPTGLLDKVQAGHTRNSPGWCGLLPASGLCALGHRRSKVGGRRYLPHELLKLGRVGEGGVW